MGALENKGSSVSSSTTWVRRRTRWLLGTRSEYESSGLTRGSLRGTEKSDTLEAAAFMLVSRSSSMCSPSFGWIFQLTLLSSMWSFQVTPSTSWDSPRSCGFGMRLPGLPHAKHVPVSAGFSQGALQLVLVRPPRCGWWSCPAS